MTTQCGERLQILLDELHKVSNMQLCPGDWDVLCDLIHLKGSQLAALQLQAFCQKILALRESRVGKKLTYEEVDEGAEYEGNYDSTEGIDSFKIEK